MGQTTYSADTNITHPKKKKSLSQWQTNIIHQIPLNMYIYIYIYIYIKARNEKNKIKRLENWAS